MAGVTSAVGVKRGFDVGGSVDTEASPPKHSKTEEVAEVIFNTYNEPKTGSSFLASAFSIFSAPFRAVFGPTNIKISLPTNAATAQPVPNLKAAVCDTMDQVISEAVRDLAETIALETILSETTGNPATTIDLEKPTFEEVPVAKASVDPEKQFRSIFVKLSADPLTEDERTQLQALLDEGFHPPLEMRSNVLMKFYRACDDRESFPIFMQLLNRMAQNWDLLDKTEMLMKNKALNPYFELSFNLMQMPADLLESFLSQGGLRWINRPLAYIAQALQKTVTDVKKLEIFLGYCKKEQMLTEDDFNNFFILDTALEKMPDAVPFLLDAGFKVFEEHIDCAAKNPTLSRNIWQKLEEATMALEIDGHYDHIDCKTIEDRIYIECDQTKNDEVFQQMIYGSNPLTKKEEFFLFDQMLESGYTPSFGDCGPILEKLYVSSGDFVHIALLIDFLKKTLTSAQYSETESLLPLSFNGVVFNIEAMSLQDMQFVFHPRHLKLLEPIGVEGFGKPLSYLMHALEVGLETDKIEFLLNFFLKNGLLTEKDLENSIILETAMYDYPIALPIFIKAGFVVYPRHRVLAEKHNITIPEESKRSDQDPIGSFTINSSTLLNWALIRS